MHQVPNPTELTLEALYRRIDTLEADIALLDGVIKSLERVVLNKRDDGTSAKVSETQRDREREAHVRDELFAFNLNHPQQEDE